MIMIGTSYWRTENIFFIPKCECTYMWSYPPLGLLVTQLFGRHGIQFHNKTGFTLNYSKNTTGTLIKPILMSEAIC
jgi:hypothetical protein